MEKVITTGDSPKAFDNTIIDRYESPQYDQEEYKRLTDEYIERLIKDLSVEDLTGESYEVEETAEIKRVEKVRSGLGDSAASMVVRFKESRAEKQARQEEKRAFKAARKAERKEKRENMTRKEKVKQGLGYAALAAVTLPTLAYAADKMAPVETLQAADSFFSSYIPGYNTFAAYAKSIDTGGVESYVSNPTPGVIQEVEFSPSDNSFIVGGNGDPTSEGARAALGGIPGETIKYPASISPAGPETMRDSIDAAMPKMFDVFGQAEANFTEQYDIHGYSLGSVTVAEAANDYLANGGEINGNVDINLYGTPLVENTGAFSGGTVDTITDVLDGAEIVYDTQLPQNADVHSFKTDFWSNAGSAPVTSQVSMLAGFGSDGHNVPIDGQNAILSETNVMSNGGTAYSYDHIEGPQNPLLRTVEQHTPFVAEEHPDLTNFVDAIAPIGEVGSNDIPQIQTVEVIESGAAAVDEAAAYHGLAPINAEQFVDSIGAETIAPYVDPYVQQLNQPADLSQFNTPEVTQAVQQVQEIASHIPAGFDLGAEVANVTQQAQNFGIQIPRF